MYGFIMFHQAYNFVGIMSNDNDQNYNLRLPQNQITMTTMILLKWYENHKFLDMISHG